jgi:SH3-like domain-containing protein
MIALGFAGFMSVQGWGQSLCVKANSATLRAEPKASSPVTWTAARYTPLLKLDRKGNWYKVQDMDGETHWVFHDVVTTEFRCLAVRVAVTNLRQGPGKQFPFVDRPVADRYSAFKRLESQEDWYQVEDLAGVKGWLNETTVWRPTVVQTISF